MRSQICERWLKKGLWSPPLLAVFPSVSAGSATLTALPEADTSQVLPYLWQCQVRRFCSQSHQQQTRLQQKEQLEGIHVLFLVVEQRGYASCQLVLSLPSGTAEDATALSISQQLPLKASRSCMEGELTLCLWAPLWETALPSYTGILTSLPLHLLLSKPRMEVCIHYLLQWDTQWGPSCLLLDFRAASSHRWKHLLGK